MVLSRWYCIHCGQTFVSSDIDTCSLCQRPGGLVDPKDAPKTRSLVEKKEQTELKSTAGAAKASMLRWIVVGCVMLLVVGGGFYLFEHNESELKREALTKKELRSIWLAYVTYGADNKRKAPGNLEDLRPYLQNNQDCIEAIQNGTITVVWGVKNFHDAEEGSRLVIAYESQAKQTAGFAVFAYLHIENLTAEQLEKTLKKTPRE
jgi:ABC-type phosphate transport system substrate-binding protein